MPAAVTLLGGHVRAADCIEPRSDGSRRFIPSLFLIPARASLSVWIKSILRPKTDRLITRTRDESFGGVTGRPVIGRFPPERLAPFDARRISGPLPFFISRRASTAIIRDARSAARRQSRAAQAARASPRNIAATHPPRGYIRRIGRGKQSRAPPRSPRSGLERAFGAGPRDNAISG